MARDQTTQPGDRRAPVVTDGQAAAERLLRQALRSVRLTWPNLGMVGVDFGRALVAEEYLFLLFQQDRTVPGDRLFDLVQEGVQAIRAWADKFYGLVDAPVAGSSG
jgi:hypothetical protein